MNVEFISDEKLWAQADAFRQKYAPAAIPPIDVVYIAEVNLGLEIIPTPQLFSKLGMDAALASDINTIYVDEQSYMKWEAGQHWIEKRMRFSFAHELGHLVLHGDLVKADGFQSLSDFRRWARSTGDYTRAEYQANEFAGRLLVPIDLLREEYDRHQQKAAQFDQRWWQIEGMREHIAQNVAPRFGVNHQVIETRFDHEGIWPLS